MKSTNEASKPMTWREVQIIHAFHRMSPEDQKTVFELIHDRAAANQVSRPALRLVGGAQ